MKKKDVVKKVKESAFKIKKIIKDNQETISKIQKKEIIEKIKVSSIKAKRAIKTRAEELFKSNKITQDKYFYLNNGHILKNLKELDSALKIMTDKVYFYHVTKDKNDFANWVSVVLKEDELAEELRKSKTAKIAFKKTRHFLL